MNDTIYAPATPAGGAIAVIRVSGPLAAAAGEALAKRALAHGRLVHAPLAYAGIPLDDAMAVLFRGPRSYTGEDLLELHCHGGAEVVKSVLRALGALGLRPAEPGEFTKRAFLAGKLDLSAAEAVMDLISARAAASARSALAQLQGSVAARIAALEEELLACLAGADAALDYPEELEEDTLSALPAAVALSAREAESLAAEGRAGRALREGLSALLLGLPNAGKSSLLNALLGRPRAIVTPEPGTTRDLLSEETTLLGLPVRLIDSAGIRAVDGAAEREGVERARAAMAEADIVLLLLDGSAPLAHEALALLAEAPPGRTIPLRTKADLPAQWESLPDGARPLPISSATGAGLDALRSAIAERAGLEAALSAGITNERHTHALERAAEALRAAEAAFARGELDCGITDLRDALYAVGEITGKDVDGAVIDRIFERFCVGK